MSLFWLPPLSALPCPVFAIGPAEALQHVISAFTNLWPDNSFWSFDFNVRACLALLCVSICCGTVGSLVVGGRMAFFSDALAHCAFAGVIIGFLIFQALVVPWQPKAHFWDWVTPIMAGFGVLVGLGIVAVRLRTGLASDTVIGVFFSGAIGLAAMLTKFLANRSIFSLEDFLFGNPLQASAGDIVALAVLTVVTLGFLAWGYNYLLLGSFNSSLALSRRVPLRLGNYLFVALLALIVNLCLRAVGVMLISALLIIPAATAMNVSRNMRQLFGITLLLNLVVCITGPYLSWELSIRTRVKFGIAVEFGIAGTVILLSVVVFLVSMFLGPYLRRRIVTPLLPSTGMKRG